MAEAASGMELSRSGFAGDVSIATEVDATMIVPVLIDGAFQRGTGSTGPQPRP